MSTQAANDRRIILLVLSAASVLMVTMGLRMSLGLLVQPMLRDTTVTIAGISFAMATSQLMWGVSQPLSGALADRFGAWPVMWSGTLLLAAGCALTPFLVSTPGLVLTIGVMIALGAGAGSFSILMSQVANKVPVARRGFASGLLNAGGSFGQFLFAPLMQAMILWPVLGWQGAMGVLAVISLATMPLCWWLVRGDGAPPASGPSLAATGGKAADSPMAGRSASSALAAGEAAETGQDGSASAVADGGTRIVGPCDSPLRLDGQPAQPKAPPAVAAGSGQSLRQAVRQAFADRSYILLHLGFFTCGFHISFLVTHLPTEVDLCGLPASTASWSIAIIGIANVIGSVLIGWCVGHVRSKYLLFWMYASRVALIALYLASPRTDLAFYLFAIGLGLTWLATVPPTAALVGKLFGVRYLATLFGLTLLSHQIGGFLGAWLGGQAIVAFGDYGWMWIADMVLSGTAALLNLPIREDRVVRAAAAG